ncbi:uncharacterized protein PHALS_06794 [Plasmopara halstedii]|uniref:Uncharacterized protein n=1 Tax=Plasmopara halstedii TaxID=4781 RepID=A0A0P1B4G2_PLAHL|nr:uncharacterized protein PHALS_06794 [Plasmopara halstedii]CEG49004.1 hypothetical protein PHALS_06794 [Plasmopara halstedii]|eukprot:XP_024585373.1 hypothetical protein PHALS_06794 [Plasmopara halstedii]
MTYFCQRYWDSLLSLYLINCEFIFAILDSAVRRLPTHKSALLVVASDVSLNKDKIVWCVQFDQEVKKVSRSGKIHRHWVLSLWIMLAALN